MLYSGLSFSRCMPDICTPDALAPVVPLVDGELLLGAHSKTTKMWSYLHLVDGAKADAPMTAPEWVPGKSTVLSGLGVITTVRERL